MSDYKYTDITHQIIGCSMKVHNSLGCGFQEVIYQRSLAIELEKAGLVFGREVEIPIYYDGNQVGERRVDFLVADKVLVELKAVNQLENIHLAQGINYLEASGFETGLLINFGNTRLEFKRLINKFKNMNRRWPR